MKYLGVMCDYVTEIFLKKSFRNLFVKTSDEDFEELVSVAILF